MHFQQKKVCKKFVYKYFYCTFVVLKHISGKKNKGRPRKLRGIFFTKHYRDITTTGALLETAAALADMTQAPRKVVFCLTA